MRKYRAQFNVDYLRDPLQQVVQFRLAYQDGYSGKILGLEAGKWAEVVEGGHMLPSLEIPADAMDAVYEALEDYLGKSRLRPDTEVAVLREALELERARIDALLSRATIGPAG